MNYKYINKEKKIYPMRDSTPGMLITPSGYNYPSIVLDFDMDDINIHDVDPELLLVDEITDHTPCRYMAVFCLEDNTIYYLHRDTPIDILDYEIIIKRE